MNVFSQVDLTILVLTWVKYLNEWTRLWVSMTKHQKIEGVLLRQNAKIALSEARSLASCVSNLERAIIDTLTYFRWGLIKLPWGFIAKVRQIVWRLALSAN